MGYVLALLIGVSLLRSWLKRRRLLRIHERHRSQVILYSASWCVKCHRVKDLLEDQMIRFVVVDIESSDEDYAEYKSIGVRVLPAVLITGVMITGYQEEKIRRMTQRL